MDSIDEIFDESLARREAITLSEEAEDLPIGAMLLIAILAAIGGAIWTRIMRFLREIKLKTVLLAVITASVLQIALEEGQRYWIENDVSGKIHAAVPEPTTAVETVNHTMPNMMLYVMTCIVITVVAITFIRLFIEEW